MDLNLDLFIEILADRLSAIVPAGFNVQAEGGMLWYSAAQNYHVGRSATYARDNFGRYGATDEENIIGVAVQALDELQDYVSEATHTPWPGTGSQPSPHGRMRDSYLELWYGSPDTPALACERIPLLRDKEVGEISEPGGDESAGLCSS